MTMNSKGKILFVASSNDMFELKDGRKEAMGVYLNELTVPAQAVVDAGYEIVLVTPKGDRPAVDRNSVVIDHFDGEAGLKRALDLVTYNPGMQNPRSIRSVIDEGLENFAGVFVPGGHPPMTDLMQDPDLGVVLRHCHAHSKPTAFLCHGPIAAAAALPKAADFRQALVAGDLDAAKIAATDWTYTGYRMTMFSNDEEKYVEKNVLKGEVPFYGASALEAAGGRVENKDVFMPNVIEDRELITGQNPQSARSIATLFVARLDRYATARSAA
jgi:putative intracellular protease/amidase